MGKDRKLIQVADCYASATAMALERDQYGNEEPAYLLEVKNQIYRTSIGVLGYGLEFQPGAAIDYGRYSWLNAI